MAGVGNESDHGVGVVADIKILLRHGRVGYLVVVEHDTVSHREPPLRQGVGELQIDIVVEHLPVPVRALLTGHEVVSFYTRHHRQPFDGQGGVQFEHEHGQLVRVERIGRVLITAQDEQFRACVVECMEIARATHDLLRVPARHGEVLLGEITQQFVPFIESVGHVQRHILLVSVLIAVRGVRIEVRTRTAVQHIDRPAAFHGLSERALSFDEPAHRVGYEHGDIQHITCADRTLCHTGVGADLDLGNVLRFHLVQDQTYVTVDGHVVDAEVVVVDQVLVAADEQVRHHLKHIQQRLFPRQLHTLGIDQGAVCLHLDDRQTVVGEQGGGPQPAGHYQDKKSVLFHFFACKGTTKK